MTGLEKLESRLPQEELGSGRRGGKTDVTFFPGTAFCSLGILSTQTATKSLVASVQLWIFVTLNEQDPSEGS